MKLPYKQLLTIALLLPFGLCLAQPMLTQSKHSIPSGMTDTVQAVTYVAPTASGAEQHWDFHSLSPQGTPIVSFTATDALGRLVVNESNQAVFHFEQTANANFFNGFETESKVVVYDRAITKLYFPFSFGNSFEENYRAHGLYLKDTIATQLEGTYSVEADAYGSLVLPNGRAFEQALRIKTTDRYSEQICGTTETVIEKYLWYVSEYPLPVFTTVQSVSGYPNTTARDTIQAAYYALVPENTTTPSTDNNTPEDTEEPQITLFPNPATAFIEVYSDVDISQYLLRSVGGTVHSTRQVSSQEKPLRIELINTSPGWYVLNLETSSGWLIRTFVIQ